MEVVMGNIINISGKKIDSDKLKDKRYVKIHDSAIITVRDECELFSRVLYLKATNKGEEKYVVFSLGDDECLFETIDMMMGGYMYDKGIKHFKEIKFKGEWGEYNISGKYFSARAYGEVMKELLSDEEFREEDFAEYETHDGIEDDE